MESKPDHDILGAAEESRLRSDNRRLAIPQHAYDADLWGTIRDRLRAWIETTLAALHSSDPNQGVEITMRRRSRYVRSTLRWVGIELTLAAESRIR